MPGGSAFCIRPRDLRRGAALTWVLLGVLGTAAAGGWWDRELPPAASAEAGGRTGAQGRTPAAPSDVDPAAYRDAVERAAAAAVADGKSGKQAAEDVVSRSGDRWGAVYDHAEYAEFEQALGGHYTGVGIFVERGRDGIVRVARVQAGGPAARAGVRAGDLLESVDGHRATGLRPGQVVALLRGDAQRAGAGTPVVLVLRRGARTWTETLVRARLSSEPVTVTRLSGGVVMIKVGSFTKGSGERVREAVRTAPAGAGVLLDLRGNRGGLVTEAVAAASAFLDGGLVATYDVRGAQRALYADRGGDTRRPLVALIDGGTMSAAELVTGALQDRGRAVTVGTRTFGKGAVQMPTELPDGSVAELTVGHYRTPAGRSLDGRGISPDLVAADRAEERARGVLGGLGAAP
ncbi:S41 family peptidase [Streptomyces sp. NPDC093225]|uniref:S41 family peptidase n=1 Tax=Streptomyces sp. NPDC093225 TaxID=3366034 RepID=UPI00380E8876